MYIFAYIYILHICILKPFSTSPVVFMSVDNSLIVAITRPQLGLCWKELYIDILTFFSSLSISFTVTF